jgi:hypothetical protein
VTLKQAGLILGLLCAQPAAAMEAYVAVSRTAMAVTGDIRMDDFEIVFQTRKKMAFDALVGDSFVVGGRRVPASVYSVKRPEDPVLLGGNRLCGEGRVTYMASWGGDREMVLAVFTTQDKPSSDAEMCASYTYQPR